MLLDTHAHVNFNAFKDDADEVMRRALENKVWMVNVGSQYSTSKRAAELAEKYPKGVYAALGLHPIHAGTDYFHFDKFKELAKSKKVVAVGEIGLDYKPEYVSFKEKQKEVLSRQLDLARELNLPVIFHCRAAHDDLVYLLTNYPIAQFARRCVIHCFTGILEEAQKYLEMGFYLGFNGIIFKLNLDEVIKNTPLDRILVETDCPYLTPLPAVVLAKAGRNEPLFVKYIAQKIADLKGIGFEEMAEITTNNAKKLFDI